MGFNCLEKMCLNEFLQNRSARYPRSAYIRCTGVYILSDWLTVISMFGLSQMIKDHTRVTKKTQTLIDHIYTNNTDKVTNANIIHSSISDHYAIFCTYLVKAPKQPKNGHEYIQYRS